MAENNFDNMNNYPQEQTDERINVRESVNPNEYVQGGHDYRYGYPENTYNNDYRVREPENRGYAENNAYNYNNEPQRYNEAPNYYQPPQPNYQPPQNNYGYNQGYQQNYPQGNPQYYQGGYYYQPPQPVFPKNRLIAGLFGIIMGGIGLHNFYLGYTGRAIAQLLVTFFTCGLGSVWGFIEGIMIIAGAYKDNRDANGVTTREI